MNSLEEGYLKGKIIGLEHQIDQLKQQLAEKDKEIEELDEWKEWYSMWLNFMKKYSSKLTS